MCHPVASPQFESASASKLDRGEMILAVRFASDARSYPIREMAYHHVLNDVVAGVPVAVTYCTLCHTGLVRLNCRIYSAQCLSSKALSGFPRPGSCSRSCPGERRPQPCLSLEHARETV